MNRRSTYIARAGIIAALYAALTVVALTLFQGLAWGPVQFRISEALCALSLLDPAAIPGLALGCVIANLINIAIAGTGPAGLLDVVFGSLATLLGAMWAWRFRKNPWLGLAGPVLANAFIVAAYLPLLLAAYGYYTVPFTDISLGGAYVPLYLFGIVAIGLGEAVVVYGLGMPLYRALRGLPPWQADGTSARSGVTVEGEAGRTTATGPSCGAGAEDPVANKPPR